MGTVSAAADSMGVTQSGASRIISELENNVGFSLFFRSGRGIELTAQGRAFYTHVERHFVGLGALKEAVREIRSGINRRLRLACLPTLSVSILPGIVRRLHDVQPNIAIEIETASYNEGLSMLKSRRVDAVLSFLLPELDGIRTTKVAEAPYVFAAKNDHPLAARDVVYAEDLKGVEVLGLIPNQAADRGLDDAETVREKLLASTDKRIWCHTSATRYALVAAGLAVSVAEPFAAPLFRPMGVVVKRLEPRVTLQYGLSVQSDLWDAPEISALRQAVAEELREFANRENADIVTTDRLPDGP